MKRNLKNWRAFFSPDGETRAQSRLMHTTTSSLTTTSEVALRRGLVGILMALCFISHMNRVSLAVAADEKIMPQHGITPTQMGAVYSAFLLVYTLFMVPGGFAIDRVGARRALLFMGLATGGFAAATGAIGLAGWTGAQLWLGLLLARALMGLCTTPLHPASARAIANWMPETSRGLANGFVTGAALLGIAFTFPVFGKLMDWVDWPGAFFVTGACTVVITAVWARVATDYPWQHRSVRVEAVWVPKENHDAASRWSDLLTNHSLLLLTLSYAAVGYFQYLFFYWMHFYFDHVLNLGKEMSRILSSLPVLAMAMAMPLGGWLSDVLQRRYDVRVGRALIPASGMILSAVFLTMGLLAENKIWIVTCLTLALGTLGFAEGPFWVAAIELGRRHGGTAAAIMNMGGNGVGLLAPMLTPAISEQFGWQWGFGLGAIVCLLGAVCWLWIKPER